MLLPVIGLCIGLALGFFCPGLIPAGLTQYAAVFVIVLLDSIIWAICSKIKGEFTNMEFVTMTLVNAVAAILVTYIGNLLGLELYLAAIIYFGVRMLQNITQIRRYLLKNYKIKDKM